MAAEPVTHSDETWRRTAAKLAFLVIQKEFPDKAQPEQTALAADLLIECLDHEELS